MDALLFTCDHCGEAYNQNQYFQHKETLANKGQCPNEGCDLTFTQEDMKSHLEGMTCQYQLYSCKECDFSGTIAEAQEHKCFLKLMSDMYRNRAIQTGQENKSLTQNLQTTKTALDNANEQFENQTNKSEAAINQLKKELDSETSKNLETKKTVKDLQELVSDMALEMQGHVT